MPHDSCPTAQGQGIAAVRGWLLEQSKISVVPGGTWRFGVPEGPPQRGQQGLGTKLVAICFPFSPSRPHPTSGSWTSGWIKSPHTKHPSWPTMMARRWRPIPTTAAWRQSGRKARRPRPPAQLSTAAGRAVPPPPPPPPSGTDRGPGPPTKPRAARPAGKSHPPPLTAGLRGGQQGRRHRGGPRGPLPGTAPTAPGQRSPPGAIAFWKALLARRRGPGPAAAAAAVAAEPGTAGGSPARPQPARSVGPGGRAKRRPNPRSSSRLSLRPRRPPPTRAPSQSGKSARCPRCQRQPGPSRAPRTRGPAPPANPTAAAVPLAPLMPGLVVK